MLLIETSITYTSGKNEPRVNKRRFDPNIAAENDRGYCFIFFSLSMAQNLVPLYFLVMMALIVVLFAIRKYLPSWRDRIQRDGHFPDKQKAQTHVRLHIDSSATLMDSAQSRD